MAVAAGAKGGMNLTAPLAGMDDRAAIRCMAVIDGFDYFKMLFRHTIAETLNILRTVHFEDIVCARHGILP